MTAEAINKDRPVQSAGRNSESAILPDMSSASCPAAKEGSPAVMHSTPAPATDVIEPPNLEALRQCSSERLGQIFMQLTTRPSVGDLDGRFSVAMLTGLLPSMERLGHYKEFHRQGDQVWGRNVFEIAGTKLPWGNFRVEEPRPEKPGDLPVVLINYGKAGNVVSGRIRDEIRCLVPGELYLGRFNLLYGGQLHFLGYFTLSRRP